MTIAPETLFDAFLRKVDASRFNALPRVLHRVFYEASRKHSDEMASFEFLIRTEPFSPTLARLIWEFQQAEQLGRLNPDFIGYVLKREGDPMSGTDDELVEQVVSTLVELLEESAAVTK